MGPVKNVENVIHFKVCAVSGASSMRKRAAHGTFSWKDPKLARLEGTIFWKATLASDSKVSFTA